MNKALKNKKQTAQVPVIIPFKLVRIEWEDSIRPISDWQWIGEYEVPEIVCCVSVGYLIAETPQAIALAPNLGDVKRGRIQGAGIICIPRSAIRDMGLLHLILS